MTLTKDCRSLAGSVLALLLWLGCPIWAQNSSDNAVITGQVLDAASMPVSGATISIFPMETGISGGLPWAVTDTRGRYRLVSPAFGKTRFCAVKESAGFPNTQGLLFGSGKENMPIEDLTPGARLNVDIQLGQPDGILELTVIDAVSRAPAAKACITLQRAIPESMYSATVPADGRIVLPLPPAPISVKVTAPGYQPWKYSDTIHSTDAIVMGAGDRKMIVVELTKTSP